jgi:hypothetical protein
MARSPLITTPALAKNPHVGFMMMSSKEGGSKNLTEQNLLAVGYLKAPDSFRRI